MSVAAYCDLVMDQGADFAMQLYWTDFNSDPFYVVSPMRMDIKDQSGQTVATLVTDDEEPLDANKTILYNSDTGLIQLQLPAVTTREIPQGLYKYDLWVTYNDNMTSPSTRMIKLLYGTVSVKGRVSNV